MPAPRVPVPAEFNAVPFTTGAAADRGLTQAVLRGGRFVRLTQGVWTLGPDPDLRVRVAGALEVLPSGTAATGRTGLQLHGVDLGPSAPLTLVSTHPHQIRRAGLDVVRRSGLPPPPFVESPPDCFATSGLPLVQLVAAGDRLVHLRLASPEELAAAVIPGRRGSRTARRAAELVRPRVESYKETELRLVAVLADLPEPSCNLDIGTDTRWLARGDLVWRDFGVVAEYDGLQHLTERAQWERDVVRLEQLARAGWIVIRVTAARLHRPRQLVADLERALREGGWTGGATLGREWNACFASAR